MGGAADVCGTGGGGIRGGRLLGKVVQNPDAQEHLLPRKYNLLGLDRKRQSLRTQICFWKW